MFSTFFFSPNQLPKAIPDSVARSLTLQDAASSLLVAERGSQEIGQKHLEKVRLGWGRDGGSLSR